MTQSNNIPSNQKKGKKGKKRKEKKEGIHTYTQDTKSRARAHPSFVCVNKGTGDRGHRETKEKQKRKEIEKRKGKGKRKEGKKRKKKGGNIKSICDVI